MAASVIAYQCYYQTDFDHCGVVIVERTGVPYILELTPFRSKPVQRRVDSRILHSQSHQILLVSINHDDLKVDQGLLVAIKSGFEASEIMKGIASDLSKKIFGRNFLGWDSCPSLSLVRNVYRSLGLHVSTIDGRNPEDLTCEDILKRNLILRAYNDKRIIHLTEENILLRTA